MKNAITVDALRETIAEIASAEKITKAKLGEISRHILMFLNQQRHDRIEVVNELLAVLTPMNKSTAILFFRHFLPWGFNESTSTFEKQFDAGKKTDRKLADTDEFLATVENTIWTWAAENVQIDKVPDYGARITNSIKAGLKGKGEDGEGKLSKYEVVRAIMAGGMEAEALLDMIGAIEAANASAMAEITSRTEPEAEAVAPAEAEAA